METPHTSQESTENTLQQKIDLLSRVEEDYINGHSSVDKVIELMNEIQEQIILELIKQGKISDTENPKDFAQIEAVREGEDVALASILQENHPVIRQQLIDTQKVKLNSLIASVRTRLSADFILNIKEEAVNPDASLSDILNLQERVLTNSMSGSK